VKCKGKSEHTLDLLFWQAVHALSICVLFRASRDRLGDFRRWRGESLRPPLSPAVVVVDLTDITITYRRGLSRPRRCSYIEWFVLRRPEVLSSMMAQCCVASNTVYHNSSAWLHERLAKGPSLDRLRNSEEIGLDWIVCRTGRSLGGSLEVRK
jgi:hypothetical protein